jgi:hypothetical protein
MSFFSSSLAHRSHSLSHGYPFLSHLAFIKKKNNKKKNKIKIRAGNCLEIQYIYIYIYISTCTQILFGVFGCIFFFPNKVSFISGGSNIQLILPIV